ncbi:MAG: outer membrane beta-barrel protein [Acidobacteria bacterium]|nr:outer membrane beta-barrel protein [Acidobacteriota bacterium]
MRRLALGAVALVGLAAGDALAQGFALSAHGGYFDLAGAKDSAEAVFGSSGGPTFGGEVAYGFDNGFYVAAGASYFKKDGERVFVADAGGPVFKLGHPLSARILPAYATLGYRFRRSTSLVPYVAIGGGITSYREESTVAGLESSASATKPSGRLVAGLELGRGSFRLGVEASYSTTPDTIGVGGVSKIYGEDDVGGFSVVGKIVFTRARR